MRTTTEKFEKAMLTKIKLEKAYQTYSDILKTYPRGTMGLTFDEVKADAKWKINKRNATLAFKILRNFNQNFVRVYKKEYAEFRLAQRVAKLALN